MPALGSLTNDDNDDSEDVAKNMNLHNPSSNVKESGVQCLESVGTAQNPESKH